MMLISLTTISKSSLKTSWTQEFIPSFCARTLMILSTQLWLRTQITHGSSNLLILAFSHKSISKALTYQLLISQISPCFGPLLKLKHYLQLRYSTLLTWKIVSAIFMALVLISVGIASIQRLSTTVTETIHHMTPQHIHGIPEVLLERFKLQQLVTHTSTMSSLVLKDFNFYLVFSIHFFQLLFP